MKKKPKTLMDVPTGKIAPDADEPTEPMLTFEEAIAKNREVHGVNPEMEEAIRIAYEGLKHNTFKSNLL